jgi:glycosyltransferase involved in cell wall biosynthesis
VTFGKLNLSQTPEMPISAVLITKNEAHCIEQCLQSLSFCSEIVVIDSGSTDATLDICKKYGCISLFHAFDGYGAQKNFAVRQATHDWVFCIDADEVVTDELQHELQRFLPANTPLSGYEVPRSLVFMGKKLRRSKEFRQPIVRFFNKKYGNYTLRSVHETVELTGKIGRLQGELLHYSYRNVAHYFEKMNVYTDLGATVLFEEGKKISKQYVYFRGLTAFLEWYIGKGLFLDGFTGFCWAKLQATYTFVKYLKLYERNN